MAEKEMVSVEAVRRFFRNCNEDIDTPEEIDEAIEIIRDYDKPKYPSLVDKVWGKLWAMCDWDQGRDGEDALERVTKKQLAKALANVPIVPEKATRDMGNTFAELAGKWIEGDIEVGGLAQAVLNYLRNRTTPPAELNGKVTDEEKIARVRDGLRDKAMGLDK